MPDTTPQEPQTPNHEVTVKLRQIRANYTRAQNILAELETYFTKFEELRDKLDDKDDGLTVNYEWSGTKKLEMDGLVTAAKAKATELEGLAANVAELVGKVEGQIADFDALAAKVTDPTLGIQAMHTQATNLTGKITTLLETARSESAFIDTEIKDIKTKSTEVEEAYDAFMELKEKVDDPKTGVQAQVDEIEQFVKDASKAKTSAENELAAVISLKDRAGEDLETIGGMKEEIAGHKDESAKLTADIRNNLGLSSAHTLSEAITDQRKRIERSVWLWGAAVAIAVIILGGALGMIYYTIFLDPASKELVKADGLGLFVTVLSKALFSSPFVFALYFSTTNFSRARDLRDRYRSKEIAAINLQAYVKLLRDEFPDNSDERLKFALHNMQAIYNDPLPGQRKRRYNIGINKIFQFDVQEEDIEQLKEKLVEGAEEIVENKVKSGD